MPIWREADHPRDDEGKFTYKNGGTTRHVEKNIQKVKPEEIFYKKTMDKENEAKCKNKLLGVLGDLATREEILFGTVPELLHKIKENGLEKSAKFMQIIAEFGLGEGYKFPGYQYAKWKYGKDTVGMVDLAHETPKNSNYGANAIELNSYEDIKNMADREYLEKKISEQYKDYGYNPKEIKGRIFQSNTEPSQRVAQDKDFLLTIQNNKNKILNQEDVSGYFPRYKDNKESNWHFAIGHYDLRNGYLDQRGNLHIQMFDTYDFNKDNHTVLN